MSLRLRTDVALAPLTTFGVGGQARWFVSVSNSAELREAVRLAKQKKGPYHLIAGGSNVVFGDKTFPGLVIHFTPKASPYQRQCQRQGATLTCAANFPLAQLIKTAISHSLAGLETLSGIPGTVGGAIVGNAGAYGQCISDHLVRAQILNVRNVRRQTSNIQWLSRKQCLFAYRESIFKQCDWLVLRAEFKLKKGDKKQLAAKAREIIKIRAKKYKPGLRCPGSFFKNVLMSEAPKRALKLIDPTKIIEEKIPAGYLLEQVGAKGLRRGGVRVADFHGNLLINAGRATYRDVRALAALLKRRVQKKFGLRLKEEIRYMV